VRREDSDAGDARKRRDIYKAQRWLTGKPESGRRENRQPEKWKVLRRKLPLRQHYIKDESVTIGRDLIRGDQAVHLSWAKLFRIRRFVGFSRSEEVTAARGAGNGAVPGLA